MDLCDEINKLIKVNHFYKTEFTVPYNFEKLKIGDIFRIDCSNIVEYSGKKNDKYIFKDTTISYYDKTETIVFKDLKEMVSKLSFVKFIK